MIRRPPRSTPLSLHDALPISVHEEGPRRRLPLLSTTGRATRLRGGLRLRGRAADGGDRPVVERDRKSTRLNSSHVRISYAVFCLKKKKNKISNKTTTQIVNKY